MLLTKMALTDAPGVTLGWVSWGYLMDIAEKVKQFKILLNILLKREYFLFFFNFLGLCMHVQVCPCVQSANKMISDPF